MTNERSVKMKWLWVTVVISLVSASFGAELDHEGERLRPLRRHVRAAMDAMSQNMITLLETKIIAECKVNEGNEDIGSKLQNIFSNTKSCLGKMRFMITPKDEFLNSYDECTKEAVEKTSNCLKANHQYLPGVMKQFFRNLITVMYNDIDIIRDELGMCMRSFQRSEVQTNFIQCAMDVEASEPQPSSSIPESKEEYCRTFIPAHHCFGKTLRKYCSNTAKISKFIEDYNKAGEDVCNWTKAS